MYNLNEEFKRIIKEYIEEDDDLIDCNIEQEIFAAEQNGDYSGLSEKEERN